MSLVKGTKKQMYALLSLALVVVVGGGAFVMLGGSSDNSYENGPPVLEENPALTGTLSVAGERFFNVETIDKTGDNLRGHTPKSPSNFLIFTTPKDASGFGEVTKVMEDLLVDDGNSGYVFGTFKENQWHLYPEKNYRGALRLDETKQLEACRTYFVIKIDDNSQNGSRAGWAGEDRLKIAYEQSVFDTVNTGGSDCEVSDRSILENQWNLVSTNGSKTTAVQADLAQLFESTKAVWDTSVINQSAGQANTQVFVLGKSDASLFTKYLSDEDYLKKASLFPLEGMKRDMWIYVGDKVKPVEVAAATLTPVPQTVNLSSKIEGLISSWRENPDGFREKMNEFLNQELEAPSAESFRFENVVAKTDLKFDRFEGSFSGFELSDNKLEIANTGKRLTDVVLVGDDSKSSFVLPVQVGLIDQYEISEVNYLWENNRCKATEDRLFEFYLEEFKTSIYTVVNNAIENNNPDLTLDRIKEQLLADPDLSERVKEVVRSLSDEERIKNLDNPPSLSGECAGDFASCARAMVCSSLGLGELSSATIKIESGSTVEQERQQTVSVAEPIIQLEGQETESQVRIEGGNQTFNQLSVTEQGQTVSVTEPIIQLEGQEIQSQVRIDGGNQTFTQPEGLVGSNQNVVVASTPESCIDPIQFVAMYPSRQFGVVEPSIEEIMKKDVNLDISNLALALDISNCTEFLQIENFVNNQLALSKLEQGQVYRLSSEDLYIQDTYDPSKNTKSTRSVFVTLSESGRLYVFLRPVPDVDTQIFDGNTLYVGDGLFWDLTGERDLNGIFQELI